MMPPPAMELWKRAVMGTGALVVAGFLVVPIGRPVRDDFGPSPDRRLDIIPVLCDGHAATILGTEGSDILTGTPGPDVIAGRGGDDEIRGGGGDDILCGGGGDDLILGEAGDDRLLGHGGVDVLVGGSGTDWGSRDAADRCDASTESGCR